MDVEERKLATIVFADLVGSTELGGSQDPERTRALLDRFYDAMADEIGRAGGTVEKFAGDAVMAVFGAPAALEDHAERALHAALALLHRTRELDARLVRAYEWAVEEQAPRLVTILGDAGVGKTRLVRELWEQLAAFDLEPLRRTGRCLSHGAIAYWALGEVLLEQFGLLESDPPER